MKPKERAAARRLTIYQHLARRVGYAAEFVHNDIPRELASQIARFCVRTDVRPTPIDGYRVWCEINDMPLKDEGLSSLFASIPTADEKLRQLYMDVELEEHRLMMQREKSVHKEEQKKLREFLREQDVELNSFDNGEE